VASRTDPYLTFERATELAKAWGSSLVEAGDAGHLNTDAGYGPWPDGEGILSDLQAGVGNSEPQLRRRTASRILGPLRS
jgi:predicted alpha/beta hydrolase family esterase